MFRSQPRPTRQGAIDAAAAVEKTDQAPARLQRQNLTRDELLLKLGAARKEAGKAYALLVIHMPTKDQPVTSEHSTSPWTEQIAAGPAAQRRLFAALRYQE
jgi:hypothetical protein